MPRQADEVTAALLIWLFIEDDGSERFRARITATRGLDPAPYRQQHARDADRVCAIVRSWLDEELGDSVMTRKATKS